MDLRSLYQEVILDHNRSPRNFGPLEDADLQADGHNPLCGDRLLIAVKVDDGVVTDVRFQGSGCAISQASASLMTEGIKGKTLDEALQIKNTDIVQELSLPPVKIHCSILAEDAIRSAIADYQNKQSEQAGARSEQVSSAVE